MMRDAPASEELGFDTEALPPAERMDRYRALYGIGAEVTATGPAPRATFRGWRLDRAILYDRRLNDIGHSRAAAALARYGLSHWTATLVLEGWVAFDLSAGFRQVQPGEILFVDTNTPSRNDAKQAHVATLSIAQDRLEAIVGPLGGLHGLVIPAENGRLYADFVRSLLMTLPAMNSRALAATTSALGLILKGALDAQGWTGRAASSARESQRLAQVRALVDARLADAAFGTDAVIAETGLSRATLYRLLHPHGGLAAFIQHQRLEQVRRRLSDPGEQGRFAALACDAGFRDEGQASRAFTAQFGVRPGAYRAAVVAAEPDAQFRAWQQDLL